MGLLERLIGADAARDFRERMLAAQAAQAAQAAPVAPGGPSALRAARAPAAISSPASDAPARPDRPAAGAARTRSESRSLAAGAPGAGLAAHAAPGVADPLGLTMLGTGDFPTSILATAAEPAPPLLAAFANRSALLAAVVFSEALAPPVALR